jgi:tRNA (mo5U34)-methyltransferase
MIDYTPLYEQLSATPLSHWTKELPKKIEWNLREERYAHMPEWTATLSRLPTCQPETIDLLHGVIAKGTSSQELETTLRELHPWRKGPYHLYGMHIDTEWRSDWKWDRLIPHIEPLKDRLVLDVGCGSGYHTWRMAGAGARLAIGIDPQPLFICQYFAVKHLLQTEAPAWVIPMTLEDIPATHNAFDSVFSMGVLYHRKNPHMHLKQLHALLRKDGEVILETLVIPDQNESVLIPKNRYAKMRNVWSIPSVTSLERWVTESGFQGVRTVDITPTTPEEQRATPWMNFESLSDFLDPQDAQKTIEGHPAPLRAIVIAKK